LLLLAALAACRTASQTVPAAQRHCAPEVRGAFDIGSGSTKVQAALVTACRDGGHTVEVTVERVCWRGNEPVPYSAELKKSSDNRLPEAVVASGLAAMERLRREAVAGAAARCGAPQVRQWRAIMTEVFRNAANAAEVRDRISSALAVDGRPMPIKVLSQDEEALYGYYPILHTGAASPDQLAVWDMGGGSTQVTVFGRGASGIEPRVLKTHLGTGTFGAALLARRKTLGGGDALNPMGPELLQAGMEIIRQETEPAAAAVGVKPTDMLRGRTVVGIGGVLAISVPKMVTHAGGRPAAALSVIEFGQRARSGGLDALRRAGVEREAIGVALHALAAKDDAQILELARRADVAAGFAPSLPSGLLLAWGYSAPEVLDVPVYTPVQMDATDTMEMLQTYDEPAYWDVGQVPP